MERAASSFESFSNDSNTFHPALQMALDLRTNLSFITQIKSKVEIMALLLKQYLLLLLGEPLVRVIK
jgi:hypothetical protein